MVSPTDINPFVGLRPFESDESLLFFGRQEQTMELLQRLHQHHFVAIIGNSGCGKSSLIRGGLIPRLKAGYLVEERDKWMIVMMKPGQSPLHNLASALINQLNNEENEQQVFDLVKNIREEGADALLHLLKPLWEQRNTNFFLLVDQFEELFRFSMNQKDADKRDEARDFVNIILELSKQSDIPVYVVMTMRSDFIGDCAEFYGLPEAMNQSQFLVPRLNRNNLKSVIEGPVRLYGGNINPALTSKLLNDAIALKDELPLLQHALMRIWDHEKNVDQSGELDMNDYDSVGGIENALSNHADEAMEGMTDKEIDLTKKIFQALTIVDENGRKVRRPALLGELEAITGESKEQLVNVINRFSEVKRSFLVVSKEGDLNDVLIDISHESLIRQWNKLSAWTEEEAASAKIYLHLAESAELYREKKKDLLEGSEYQIAEKWYKDYKPSVAWSKRYNERFEETVEYLKQSGKEQKLKEKRKRSIRRSLWMLVSGLVILSGVAFFFIMQKTHLTEQKENEKRIKDAFQLNALALTEVNDDPTIALRIAEAGYEKEPDSIIRATMQKIYSENAFYKIAAHDPFAIYAAAISPDGAQIVTASEDGTARVWNLHDSLLKELKGHTDTILAVAYSPDGSKILTGSNDKTARLWTRDGKFLHAFKGHTGSVYAIAFSHDGNKILTGSHDSTAILWDTMGNIIMRFKGHMDNVNGVAFSIDDKNIFTSSYDTTARMWNLNGKVVREYRGGHTRGLLAVAVSPDGKQIVTSSFDNTAILWDIKGKMLKSLKGHTELIKSVAFSSDGAKVLTGSADKTARLWDLDGNVVQIFKGHKSWVVSATFTVDGTKMLTAGYDKTARIWYLGNNLSGEFKEKDQVYTVAFSNDGNRIATGFGTNIGLWNLDRSLIKEINPHSDTVKSIAFSRDGTKFLSGSADKIARIYDMNGSLVQSLRGHKGAINSIAFSPDGTKVLTGSSDKTARLWNLNDSSFMEFKCTGSVIAVAFSSDGSKSLTFSKDGTIGVWYTDDGSKEENRIPADEITSAAFSADGNNLLTGFEDGRAALWNLKGNLIREYKGHKQAILTVAFSLDGAKILTGSDDKVATLWSRDGRLLTEFKGHDDCVFGVAISPDGTKVLTGSEDHTARLWNIMPLDEFLKSDKIDQLTEEQKKEFKITDK